MPPHIGQHVVRLALASLGDPHERREIRQREQKLQVAAVATRERVRRPRHHATGGNEQLRGGTHGNQEEEAHGAASIRAPIRLSIYCAAPFLASYRATTTGY